MITVLCGDITTERTDAIVNSANPSLLAGSGLSGAIHAAAGSKLEEECLKLGGCAVGDAKITAGYLLPARFVIHAVAPRYWDGTRGEKDQLRKTFDSIFKVAALNQIKSISIPSIGTGIYRFPLNVASRIALEIAYENVEQFDIRFVCFSKAQLDVIEDLYRSFQQLKQ